MMKKAFLLYLICTLLTACGDRGQDPLGIGDATAGAVSGYGGQLGDALAP